MLHRTGQAIYFAVFFGFSLPVAAFAQNLIVDGGFDGAPQTQVGDRWGKDLPPWRFATATPAGLVIQNSHNLVAVDGPGGGDYLDRGPESDASNAGAGVMQYYIDSGSFPQLGWQYFTPTCRGTATAKIYVANREGHGRNGSLLTGAEVPAPPNAGTYFNTQGGLAVFPVGHEITTFPSGFAVADAATTLDVQGLIAQYDSAEFAFLLPAGVTQTYPWTPISYQVPVEPGQLYAYMVELGHSVNMDNASVVLDCSGTAPSAPPLTPEKSALAKTCETPIAGVLDGDAGQFWNCQIDVTTQPTPFGGILTVNDLPTQNFSSTSGQLISMTSAEAGITCTSGQSCAVDGAVFDGAGVIDVQSFVRTVDIEESYLAENCTSGSYSSGASEPVGLDGNCVTASFVPGLEISKTCDPVQQVSSGPMTLNCQLTVTGNNLPTGSFAGFMDVFGAVSGSADPFGPLLGGTGSVTSNEPWDCVDQNGVSGGICTLPAADLIAAGGTSVVNTTFQFTVGPDTPQVANCALEAVVPLSASDWIAQGDRTPQQMPDNCVAIDVPPYTDIPEEPEPYHPEKVEVKKTCDEPVQATVAGVQGYTWACRAEITVSPTPFVGSFVLEDDASNISIGAAQFLSASEPSCTGLGTDQLTCSMNGSAMLVPHVVSYQLFTAVTDADTPFKWQNCARGIAAAQTKDIESGPSCVDTYIKPQVVRDPPKESNISKTCDAATAQRRDGVEGMEWVCHIKVTAAPVPFGGSISFTEDATAVFGSSAAHIVAMAQQGSGWNCSSSLPAQTTDCSIDGADFAPSGIEEVTFTLFAAAGDGPINWRNCVSGSYSAVDGKARKLRGNCEEVSWKPGNKPSTPPSFSLKKGCDAPVAYEDAQRYLCTIQISQTGGDPITAPLTLSELFSTVSGAPALDYLLMLQGSNGWQCATPNFANGADCTIQPADFNGISGHQIAGMFVIPNAVLEKEDFKNCAALKLGDAEVASAPCVDIAEPEPKPVAAFDVEKTCKPAGDRMVFSPSFWMQPYECTLVVSNGGLPFTGPLWLLEDMHFGQNPAASSIQSISSTDPWVCSSPPYAVGGTQPYCSIQGSQFPASGSSAVTVNVLVSAVADIHGAENCASILLGQPDASGLPPEVGSSCFVIAEPPEVLPPQIDLVKACAPTAIRSDGTWAVDCTLTVTGQNLPAGQPLRVTDELMSSVMQTAVSGQLTAAGSSCAGGQIAGGVTSACDLMTDDVIAAGGTLVIPYTGVFAGVAGRPFGSPQAQNCGFVDVASLGLHGPAAGGKSCVPLSFLAASVGGGLPAVPNLGGTGTFGSGTIAVQPDLPAQPQFPATGASASCSLNTHYIVDISGSMFQGNRMNQVKATLAGAYAAFEGGGSMASLTVFNHIATNLISPAQVLPSQALLAATQGIQPFGSTNWNAGLVASVPVVSATWPRPLVFFITDGQGGAISPQVLASIRGAGSRIIGIMIGPNQYSQVLANALGASSIVAANSNTPIDPFTTDMITIGNAADSLSVFQKIAAAYCPTDEKSLTPALIAAQQGLLNIPISDQIYAGDDEPLDVQMPPVVPEPKPDFAITKSQTSACVANRQSQTYECGFRLAVTNTGNRAYAGPLTVTDIGRPAMRAAKLLSGNGWTCAQPVAGAVSCENTLLNLAPAATSHLDLSVTVAGMRRGGTFENCAGVGIPDEPKQRVAAIQQVMNARGLNAGPVDGLPGARTYAALAQLQATLGLPISRDFDDALFVALGLPLQQAGAQSCVIAELPPMPAPPLQCDPASTISKGEGCECRFADMAKRNATTCQCMDGTRFVKGRGCVAPSVVDPKPVPHPMPDASPDTTALKCDTASTRKRGGQCVCIDQRNAKKLSATQCGCTNGLPMINGKCIPIDIAPPQKGDGVDGEEKCLINLNGICIK